MTPEQSTFLFTIKYCFEHRARRSTLIFLYLHFTAYTISVWNTLTAHGHAESEMLWRHTAINTNINKSADKSCENTLQADVEGERWPPVRSSAAPVRLRSRIRRAAVARGEAAVEASLFPLGKIVLNFRSRSTGALEWEFAWTRSKLFSFLGSEAAKNLKAP